MLVIKAPVMVLGQSPGAAGRVVVIWVLAGLRRLCLLLTGLLNKRRSDKQGCQLVQISWFEIFTEVTNQNTRKHVQHQPAQQNGLHIAVRSPLLTPLCDTPKAMALLAHSSGLCHLFRDPFGAFSLLCVLFWFSMFSDSVACVSQPTQSPKSASVLPLSCWAGLGGRDM